jgi:hypothetical protein
MIRKSDNFYIYNFYDLGNTFSLTTYYERTLEVMENWCFFYIGYSYGLSEVTTFFRASDLTENANSFTDVNQRQFPLNDYYYLTLGEYYTSSKFG